MGTAADKAAAEKAAAEKAAAEKAAAEAANAVVKANAAIESAKNYDISSINIPFDNLPDINNFIKNFEDDDNLKKICKNGNGNGDESGDGGDDGDEELKNLIKKNTQLQRGLVLR